MLSQSILAIDTDNLQDALELGERVKGQVYTVKLGLQFFNAHGKEGVRKFNNLGYNNLMLDLKLHDIPKTVYKAIKSLGDISFGYITIHGQGGREMIDAAKFAASEISCNPEIMMVTVLTSISYDGVKDYVKDLTLMAKDHCVGVICSGLEASMVRDVLGPVNLIFTPGIRFQTQDTECHRRTCTPQQSLENGASKIIIGVNCLNHMIQSSSSK